jgi:hypothetical protein
MMSFCNALHIFFQVTNNTLVCSAHFLDADIKKSLTGKRMLVKDSVPSLFAWTATPSKRVGPQKRARVYGNIIYILGVRVVQW